MKKISCFLPAIRKSLCNYSTTPRKNEFLWKKEGILDDWQNAGNRSETITEKWEAEKNDVTDISRLPKYLKNRTLDRMIVSQPDSWDESCVDFQRKVFAMYGQNSGINPGEVCWPSPEYLDLWKDREINYEEDIVELMDQVKLEKESKEKCIEDSQERIRQKLTALPKMIEQYHKNKAKQELEAAQKNKKRELLMKEAREYFGFTVQMHDPKMDKFLELKKEEEKKEQKDRKKAKKLKLK